MLFDDFKCQDLNILKLKKKQSHFKRFQKNTTSKALVQNLTTISMYLYKRLYKTSKHIQTSVDFIEKLLEKKPTPFKSAY